MCAGKVLMLLTSLMSLCFQCSTEGEDRSLRAGSCQPGTWVPLLTCHVDGCSVLVRRRPSLS